MAKNIRCTYAKFQTNTKSWISIEKVHTIIKFKQEPWLKQYIEMNREL